MQDGIDVTVLVDSAAGYLISQGNVDAVIVGADRIAANGDTANKIEHIRWLVYAGNTVYHSTLQPLSLHLT